MSVATTIDIAADPFTAMHRALWSKLTTHPRFAAMVRLRNRIDYTDGTEDPEKGAALTTDHVEATLVPVGGAVGTWRTRDTFELTMSFMLALDSGSLRLHRVAYPVQWATLCALAGADDDCGLPFVRRVDVSTLGTVRTDEAEDGRQWRSVARIDVLCTFARTDMKGHS